MALITGTVDINQEDRQYTVTWANITETDTAAPHLMQQYAEDISVDLDGTWGSSTLAMWGNNGGDGAAMKATDQATASWSADAMFSILPRASAITPVITTGIAHSISVRMTIWY